MSEQDEQIGPEPVNLNPIDGIARDAVQSSNIASLGYDTARQVLAVQFRRSDDVIHYDAVPDDLAVEFFRAPSAGKFFHQHIRGKYKGRMMTGPCDACRQTGVVGEACECGEGRHVERQRVTNRPDESEVRYVG